MRSLPRLALALLGISLFLSWTIPVQAQESRAEALISQGVELVRAGEHEAALALFQQAYELEPSPRAAAQIGLAEGALERWVASERHLTLALSATDDEWISTRREPLEGRLVVVRQHLGTIEIHGGAPNAIVRVDGEVAGRLPLMTARVVTGEHLIEVADERLSPFRSEVQIEAGQTRSVTVPGPLAEEPEGGEQEPAPADPGAELWTPGWILAGVGGALLIGGIITGVMTSSLQSELEGECGGAHSCDSMTLADESFQSRVSEGQTLAAVTDALLFGGIGIAAAGVILAFVLAEPAQASEDRGEPEEGPELSAFCDGRSCAASLRLRF